MISLHKQFTTLKFLLYVLNAYYQKSAVFLPIIIRVFLRAVFFSEYFVNSNMDGKKGYTYPNPMILDQVRDNNVTLPCSFHIRYTKYVVEIKFTHTANN